MARTRASSKAADKPVTLAPIDNVDACELLDTAMASYSYQTIYDRAIPDVRDGHLPVVRRILYSMSKLGATSTKKHMKVARITGDTMGNYHPHGDSSITGALTLQTQSWRQRVPLIDIEGNNGNIDGDSAAAARYIEARLTTHGEHAIGDYNLGGVDFIPTYDKATTMPAVLPATWPVLLVNGTDYMAVGYSTKIAPHNPLEVMKAARAVNKNPNVTLKKLMSIVPAPDLPTGGTIATGTGVEEMYRTGQGTFSIRANTHIDGRSIFITSVPYGVTKRRLKDSIGKALVAHKLDDCIVGQIYDNSEGDDVSIELQVKKGVDPHSILDFLFAKSDLQINFATVFNAICPGGGGHIKTLSLKEYLQEFVDFVRDYTRRELVVEQEQKKLRKEIVEGFIALVDVSAAVVEEVKKAHTKDDVVARIMTLDVPGVVGNAFTKRQAEAIAMMRIYQISNQNIAALKKENDDLAQRLEFIDLVLTNDTEFVSHIDSRLKETEKRFAGEERRTELVEEFPAAKSNPRQMAASVSASPAVIVVTDKGVQRVSKRSFATVDDSEHSSNVKVYPEASTAHAVAMFTNTGKVVQRLVTDLNETSVKDVPEPLFKGVDNLTSDENIINAYVFDAAAMDEGANDDIVCSVTKNGMVKLSPLASSMMKFSNKYYATRVSQYNGLKLAGDEVIATWVIPADAVDKISMTLGRTGDKRTTTFDLSRLNIQKKSGSGASMVRMLKPNDQAVIVSTNIGDYSL